ncbi:MAG: hypothetical protein E6R04_01365 [Spirochaetes bacterium]|nr:MAG: hypothetical protein E6R04_01365 [Spirochaetota bacterium]
MMISKTEKFCRTANGHIMLPGKFYKLSKSTPIHVFVKMHDWWVKRAFDGEVDSLFFFVEPVEIWWAKQNVRVAKCLCGEGIHYVSQTYHDVYPFLKVKQETNDSE